MHTFAKHDLTMDVYVMMTSYICTVAPSPSNLITAPKANSENAGETGLKEPVEEDMGTVGGDEGLLDNASTVQESTGNSEASGSTTESNSSAAAVSPIPESTPTTNNSAASSLPSEPAPVPSEPSPAPSEPPISMGSGFSD